MRLITENGANFDNPSLPELKEIIFQAASLYTFFVVLSQSDQQYIQATGNRFDGFSIEYREGNEREHYTSRKSNISYNDMVNIFSNYLLCESNWKDFLDWDKNVIYRKKSVKISSKRKLSIRTVALIAVFFLIGIISTGLGAYCTYSNFKLFKHAVKTTGIVERITPRTDTFVITVAFYDINKHTQKLYSIYNNTAASFFLGQEVKVIYNPNDPESLLHAKIDTPIEIWERTIIAFIFGIFFNTLSIAIYIKFKPKVNF